MSALLEVSGIDVHYGAVHALRGVSLHVDEGEIVTLVGSNGAGKSTTLRAISGLVPPSAGTIRYAGRPIHGRQPHEIVALGVAQAPEGRGVFANLTVEENLRVGAYARRESWRELCLLAGDARCLYEREQSFRTRHGCRLGRQRRRGGWRQRRHRRRCDGT